MKLVENDKEKPSDPSGFKLSTETTTFASFHKDIKDFIVFSQSAGTHLQPLYYIYLATTVAFDYISIICRLLVVMLC